ncbi:MAG: polysaccharide biosynthesis protein [Ignavibacteria bacterium]|nr:polysaccharide biosynthesis protein [Ignavibacteria bacterium]
MLSMSVAEIANKGIAIITFIYLTRILSPEGFGILGFAQSFTTYFYLIVNLGFDTVGIRAVSQNKNNLLKYVNAIITIRTILSVISFALLIGVTLLLNKPYEVKFALIMMGVGMFGNTIILNWAYQGLEKMEIIAVRQVLLSLLNMLGIIIFVQKPEHFIIAASVMSASNILNSAWVLVLFAKQFGKFHFYYNYEFFRNLLKSSFTIGMLYFIVIINNHLSTLILGLFRTNVETGYYTSAFKIMSFMVLPSTVLQNVFFPNITRALDFDERKSICNKYTILTILSGALLAALTYVNADFLISVSGRNYAPAAPVLRMLSFNIMLTYLSVAFSVPLIAWNKEKWVVKSLAIACIFGLTANLILIPRLGIYGSATATLLSESITFLGCAFGFYKSMRITYFTNFIKGISIACASGFLSYFLTSLGLYPAISIIIAIGIFSGTVLITKMITIEQLKRILKRES